MDLAISIQLPCLIRGIDIYNQLPYISGIAISIQLSCLIRDLAIYNQLPRLLRRGFHINDKEMALAKIFFILRNQ
mgnify:CR=1 FL=1